MPAGGDSAGSRNPHISRGGAEESVARSAAHGWNLRRGCRVGAWNVLTLGDDDRLPILSRELERLGVDIAALSEVRRLDSGSAVAGAYSYHWSGRTDVRLGGVAVAISSRLSECVRQVTAVDERILHVRLEHTCGFMSVVAVYAPTEEASLEDKEQFYFRLDSVVGRCPAGDVLVILGDFNAETGSDRAGYESCVGPHGFGTRNENSQFLLDFAKSRGLWIGGSWFQRSISRRLSWYSNTGLVKKEIDHVLVSTRWRLMQNCRVYRSAEFFNTDHRLVIATLRLRFRCRRARGQGPPVLDLERLRNQACKSAFAVEIENRFDALQSLDSATDWDTFKEETLEAARLAVGTRPRGGRTLVSAETLAIVDESRAARLMGDRRRHRELVRRCRVQLRVDRERVASELAREAEDGFNRNNLRPAFRAIKRLSSVSTPGVNTLLKTDGEVVVGHEGCRERLAEYFEGLYNVPPPAERLAEGGPRTMVAPDPPIREDPPSYQEVKRVVSELREGRAAGVCGVPAELLKAGGDCMTRWLRAIIVQVWSTGVVPPDWRRGLVTPIYKGRGDRKDCNNYRGITLLSVPGKVFARLLLNRIRDHLISTQRPEQAGFTPKRSTIDRILGLRILIQRRLEYRRSFMAAYVDFKKAFDSVDRGTLWELLRRRGIPAGILSLISALYTNTESAIKSGGDVSRFFPVNSGVRQGCVLAPTLFNTCIDWVMGETVEKTDCGISLGEDKITDLDFADDVVIFAETLEVLVHTLDTLSLESEPLGLKVSWTKTKIQEFVALLDGNIDLPPPVTVQGEHVHFVDSFVYLGSAIGSGGRSFLEINRRLGIASSVMNSLNRSVWRCRYLCRRTKIRLFRALVLPVLLYGSETWSIGARERGRLNSFSTRALRRIMGYRWDDFVTNERVLREAGMSQVTCMIRQRQLRLFGHVARFPESDPVSRVISQRISPAWRRPRGRPPVTWLQRIDGHCREMGLAGREHAWHSSRRDPQGWRRAVTAATRCLGVCPH